jgi:glycosidase
MPGQIILRGVLALAIVSQLAPAMAARPPARAYEEQAPVILKIDPPNWWAQMPAPMLLVRGEGLRRATFSLSDRALRIEKTVVSENGHWAQLWLAASPAQPETVTLRVARAGKNAAASYQFGERKPQSAGFAGFSSADVLYLIMTDRFADGDLKNDGPQAQDAAASSEAEAERAKPRGWHGGDYRGIIEHLDYLQQLGVTAVWVTPPYENLGAESYHGYHATDMYRVDPHWGSMDDLQTLTRALHRRGMKLVLDTVPNHVGPLHPWVKDEPALDWFHGTAAHHIAGETDFRALVDPHAPERDRIGTLNGWFVDQLPDMNTDSPAVAHYLRQNAIWWVEETGADGLRIDTFPYVGRSFWHEYLTELHALFPRLTEVGEVSTGDPMINSSFAGGVVRAGGDTELYTPFDYPMYFAARYVFAKNASMAQLAKILGEDSLYSHPDRLVPFLDNHDQERFAQEVPGAALRRLAFTFLLTTRGMPQLYAGDEIAMKGGDDPDNRRDFPGAFPGDAQNAFTKAGRTAEQQAEFVWIADLTRLRREHPALECGGEQVLAANQDWLVTLRDLHHESAPDCAEHIAGAHARSMVLVALHRGSIAAALDVPTRETWMEGCHLAPPMLGSKQGSARVGTDGLHLQLGDNDVLMATCE